MQQFKSSFLCTLLILMLSSVMMPTHAQDTTATDSTTAREWDGSSRYTVLVMGLDRRPDNSSLSVRTDTLLVVSIDPLNHQLGILSIPRDTYFALPGSPDNLVPVNTLVLRGENRQENYGLTYALETLQYNFGMYLDGYIAFDFVAFEAFIDALGGLPIQVSYTINDTTYPDMNNGFDPFYIRPGEYIFDGETALKYARSRHGTNDYVRGQRQLDIIEAVINRLRDPLLVQTLIASAPNLLNQLQGHIYTNIPPEQMIYLGLSALQLQDGALSRGALDENYTLSYPYQGDRVRVPDRNQLGALLEAIFGAEYWR